jgi:putative spermidine/putrescine transport system ATP-binding protein
MQFELKQLQKDLGVTLIFVTHDQEEAMAMADRIAVMNAGCIEQAGAPAEIYGRPRTRFVADFIGEINLFAGTWRDGAFRSAWGMALPADGAGRAGPGTIAVRPERMRFVPAGEAVFSGTIESANYLGGHVLYRIATDAAKLLVRETGTVRPVGAKVGVAWSAVDTVALED